ncbi:MAG: glycerol-3-phosphate 1-O-acyltransferase PlsY [Alphaproteobacteria bacterium]
MGTYIPALLALLGGYLLGSIPFGLVVTRMAGLGDIRAIGSGNIGATNVLRTGRKDLALITLIGDAGKGGAAVLIAWLVTHDQVTACLAGGAAFLGHLFPVWLGFKGGKGFATFLGVLFAVDWRLGMTAGATWLVVAGLLRYSSLSALTAAALAPIFAFWPWHSGHPVIALALFMAILIFIRHHQNIARRMKGEEPKIGANKA